MNKIISIFIFFISAAIISCGDSNKENTEAGYVNPGLGSEKAVNANKSYKIATEPACNPSKDCHAVIYSGALNGTSYVGIAVDNFVTSPASDRFIAKIYWPASTIPEGTNLTLTSCNIKIIDNNTHYELSNTTISNVDIIYSSSTGTYNVTFKTAILLSGISINADDYIHAYKYPE